MHAEGHGATERAAAGLGMQVLTLSRDMAFLGTFRKHWKDVSGGRISPTRVYLTRLPSGYDNHRLINALPMTNFTVSPAAAPFVLFAHASLLAPQVP
jgi:hypothetical protein